MYVYNVNIVYIIVFVFITHIYNTRATFSEQFALSVNCIFLLLLFFLKQKQHLLIYIHTPYSYTSSHKTNNTTKLLNNTFPPSAPTTNQPPIHYPTNSDCNYTNNKQINSNNKFI